MANRSLPIWQVMMLSAGGFAGAGKGRTFFSFWVLFIAFLGPGGSPPGAAVLGRARTVFTARVGPTVPPVGSWQVGRWFECSQKVFRRGAERTCFSLAGEGSLSGPR